MNAKRFAEINIGAVMVAITGPGEFPEPGMCSMTGIVEAKIQDRWGYHLKVTCSDGRTEFAESAHNPDEHKGIGWYLFDNTGN
jgi:hypothetical protein